MVKCLAKDGNTTILGFGITAENVRRLKEGDPIRVFAGDMDPALGDLIIQIFYGETEASIEQMLRENDLIGEETLIHKDPRLR